MLMILAGLLGLTVVASVVDPTPEPKLDHDDDSQDPSEPQQDVITGSALSDIISGTGGDDVVEAGAGDDQVDGYAGDDSLSGGDGDDIVLGDLGHDTLSGGDGADTLSGGDGDDSLAGEAGDDSLSGGFGNDVIDGGAGADSITGGDGADTLTGGAGDDALHGWTGNDSLTGGAGHDTLQGGDGNDVLDGRERAEPLAQTSGNVAGGSTEAAEDGLGTGPGGASGDGAVEPQPVPLADAQPAAAVLQERDYLNGGAGDDTLLAGAGDWATGGDGADSFVVDDWLDDPAGPATIADFNPHEDSLAIVYDPDQHPDPQLTLTPSEDDPSVLHLALDGHVVAHVLGNPDFGPGSVNLIPKGMLDAA
jgi:Ca2+-binding RTX toxin-like protein